jgi:hypothetical protein
MSKCKHSVLAEEIQHLLKIWLDDKDTNEV